GRFSALRRADIGNAVMAQFTGALHQGGGGGGVIAADIGDGTTSIVTTADGDEGIVTTNQPRQFILIELATEDETAIGEAQPVVLAEYLALGTMGGAGQ